ncbi:tetratricopeptide repeat protein [Flavobacterium sp.]|jgi:tetratricopeptide (TPR) repeat protein|uniref:tetratricopeptide repeat protein n=1 Tax=Flavobacterium sp. TaxID=239 RepID=UPI0022BA975A|nr:tetratricopeptide repeat protein [Flavobacterium sp.]MCZ8145153.1 tetratricopeptide repeat protein [Flavobacterium sp.]MCZ8367764.1 tetratricopeptide repeat protein [Flavobacterium sp.]
MKLNLAFWGLLLVCLVGHAQDAFDAGNKAYRKGKYAEAISYYEKEVAAGKTGAALHFNLGTSYYQQQQIAPAIYHLEKARLLDPTDNAITTNLGYAQERCKDTLPQLPQVGFEKMLHEATTVLSYDRWGMVAIGWALVVFVCFAGYYVSGSPVKKRRYFTGMSLSLLLVLGCLFAGFFQKNEVNSDRSAIVFQDRTEVWSEPRMGSEPKVKLREGAKVWVLSKTAQWANVRLSDAGTGWVKRTSIRELQP